MSEKERSYDRTKIHGKEDVAMAIYILRTRVFFVILHRLNF